MSQYGGTGSRLRVWFVTYRSFCLEFNNTKALYESDIVKLEFNRQKNKKR